MQFHAVPHGVKAPSFRLRDDAWTLHMLRPHYRKSSIISGINIVIRRMTTCRARCFESTTADYPAIFLHRTHGLRALCRRKADCADLYSKFKWNQWFVYVSRLTGEHIQANSTKLPCCSRDIDGYFLLPREVSGAASRKHRPDCAENDFEIEPWAPMINVGKIKRDIIVKGRILPRLHLP